MRQKHFFNDLLDEHKSSIGITSTSKFYQVSKKLAQKDQKRFMAVDEKDRDEIFQDYLDDLLKKEQQYEGEQSKQK